MEILYEDIRGLNFEFLDPNDLRWVDRWSTEQAAGQPGRLPTQVKISLTVAAPNGRSEVTYTTRVNVPIRYSLNHAVYLRR